MEHILVIEDNLADAELIRKHLADAGFKHKLFQASSLKQGLGILRDNEVDIVLLDLSLPDTYGFSTLKSYLKEAAAIPVIILTGNNNEIVGIQSVKAGAQDYLIKGAYSAKRLVNSIRYSIQRFKAQSKLRQTANELTLKEKRAREAHQIARFGSWEMDIVSNGMKWSEETYRIFGFQPNSFSPGLSDYLEFVHVADQEKVNNFFEEVIRTGEVSRINHRILINNRTIKYLTVRARVNYDEITNKILLIGSVQDITYQKDNQLLQQETVKESQDEKTSRFTSLSYDIRTPMSSIVNLLYLLEKSNFTNQQLELIDGLKNSVDDLTVVLNNLLNYSLYISEELRVHQVAFDLGLMVRNVARSSQFKAEQAEMIFEFSSPKELPSNVVGDESKIQQVLLNLFEMAITHTVGGNRIRMTVEMIPNDTFQVAITYSGTLVNLFRRGASDQREIHDNLSGDDQADQFSLSHLSPFITVKLAKLLGGNLEAEITAGHECILIFQLPLTINDPEGSNGKSRSIDKLVKILLVEDHFLNQIATKKVLTSWSTNVNVVTADNGEEAIEYFNNEKIDLILMDLKIPKISGIEAARIIREKSNVPIIALTASSSKQEEERCFTVGMNAYIPKPIKPEELYSKITQLLN